MNKSVVKKAYFEAMAQKYAFFYALYSFFDLKKRPLRRIACLEMALKEMEQNTFTIKLAKFEGPFDLLLFFIERDELDIYDIPIAKITDDFLAFLHAAKTKNIDIASSFIVVAATLMRIKAKMLLPRKEIDEQGKEIDPREELVNRLLEYKRYKSILDELRQLEEARSSREMRGNALRELKSIAETALVDSELEHITLFKLLRVFESMMNKFDAESKKTVHRIVDYDYSIGGQQQYLLAKIANGAKADFAAVFGSLNDRIHAIVTFLALLELANMNQICIIQGEGINNFWLTAPIDEA